MIRATVYQQFSSELLERVAAMERQIDAAERARDPAPGAQALPEAAFHAHSIKGTAAVLGLHELAALAGEIERMLQACQGSVPLDPPEAGRLREGLGAMRMMAGRRPEGGEESAPPVVVAPSGGHRRRGGVVLHVEDSGMVAGLIAAILSERPGIALRSAGTAAEGLELARRLHPSVVLLDMHLPDGSGDDVLTAILADPTTRDVPVVIVSGDQSDREQDRLLAAGAAGCLWKPFEVDAVLSVVDSYCVTEPGRGG